MSSITQKRQNFRKQIRKQQLQNRFKLIRKRFFQENINQNHHQDTNIQVLKTLLERSQEQNNLARQIREGNLLNKLNHLIQSAIVNKNKLQAKYLLTIIANTFKDDINPFEKQELFKISIKIFQFLELSFVNFNKQQERRQYKDTLEYISSAVLMYYISTVIMEGNQLQQHDQQLIERTFYPALVNLLFYSLKHPKLIGSAEQFSKDFQRAVLNIFDMDPNPHETHNQNKAKRNQQFFIDIVMNHYQYINQKIDDSKLFCEIQQSLLFLYDKLTEYFEEIRQFFNAKEFWMVIEQKFQQTVHDKNSKIMFHIYSIMRTLTDNDFFLNEIHQLMLMRNQQTNWPCFEVIMKNLTYTKKNQYQIIEFLQGIVISYQEKNKFKRIIDIYGLSLFEILTNIFLDSDRQSLSDKKRSRIIQKALEIICAFIEIGNENIKNQTNLYILQFERNYGNKKLQEISQWAEEYGIRQNSYLSKILELGNWISYQFQFRSSDDEADI